ncbi:DUF4402 domain-containing protein [Piscirickettsia litoralis]|uniref:Fimbrial protein n=1 Tax=Piscirickettsia litoralis TaxID=1891921 RepID=A0ABX2ZZC3_9GAMM|nr:DUF4402 domain-containing protein [Piscirickettsia litoralis]ODN41565.1 hypothetical protein BGC07_15770 [Piscirickettsia litoralis]
MTKFLTILGLGVGTVAFASSSVTLKASVNVLMPIVVTVDDLNFGNIVRPTGQSESHKTIANLTIQGQKNEKVTIVMPDSLSMDSGKNSINVDLALPDKTPTLDQSGQAIESITASIELTPQTQTGSYSGSTTITVSYM